ncbi:MAG TPA: glycoside hydrolase family 15 protein [Ktedonobacterales bacterium]|nr:glycoside hydrolase family 15 protein [Ktedonobacterales bacterium]
MPRDLPLANGHLLVNFDACYNLRDIYWPHVGERGHTQGHINHTGIWVAGQFAWFDAPEWQRELVYEPNTLVTAVTMTHPSLNVTISCTDVVDFDRDVFMRKMKVVNLANEAREVRLFFHYDWHLGESEGANTAYYRPDLHILGAYKDSWHMILNGCVGDADAGAGQDANHGKVGVYSWATGYKEFNGQQGTWRDAEDGSLEGNPIAQGSIDSCIGFSLGDVPAGQERYCYHWLCAAHKYQAACNLNRIVIQRGPETFIQRTRDYWRLWVSNKPLDGCNLPQPLVDLYRRSLLIMRTQIDQDGAIIAATDGDVWAFARDSYAYMWPRDGALVANVLSHAGYSDATGAFFHFCAEHITEGGYLMHKYTPDGDLGSSWQPWMDKQGNLALPIQEDETALVLYALWQHYTLFHEIEFIRPLYRPLITAAADFMCSYRDERTGLPQPSWDLWEERRGVHAYTLAAVYGGLMAASQFKAAFGEQDRSQRYARVAGEIKDATIRYLWNEDHGRFVRTVYVEPDGTTTPDMVIDASLSGLYQFGMFDVRDDRIKRTMQAVEDRLVIKSEVGGVARYENDYYHQVSQDIANVPGNPWFICACWLAEFKIESATTIAELEHALPWLQWVQTHALPSGVLAEQINPYTHEPLSVSPLTWSHAEYAGAIRWYIGRYQHLTRLAAQAGA